MFAFPSGVHASCSAAAAAYHDAVCAWFVLFMFISRRGTVVVAETLDGVRLLMPRLASPRPSMRRRPKLSCTGNIINLSMKSPEQVRNPSHGSAWWCRSSIYHTYYIYIYI